MSGVMSLGTVSTVRSAGTASQTATSQHRTKTMFQRPRIAYSTYSASNLRQNVCQSRRAVVMAASGEVSELPKSLQQIVMAFQMVPDPMARYKQLLFYATKLEPLPAELHVKENKVEGCVSQVWVVPELDDGGKVQWRADSDSQLTKGLAALLVKGLSGCTPEEIVKTDPGFIDMLGLSQSLTPSRNNGFLNMFRLMQKKSLELIVASGADASKRHILQQASAGAGGGRVMAFRVMAASDAAQEAPSVEDTVRSKLEEALSPVRLEIVNDSHKHSHHAHLMGPEKPAGGDGTHFRIAVVSESFQGLNPVQRHRLIYGILAEEMKGPVHALVLDTKTPEEQ